VKVYLRSCLLARRVQAWLLLLLRRLLFTGCKFNGYASVLQVGAKLVVLNLSQQTDSSDLVGGFKPVEPRDALLPLLDTFQRLVRLTWSKGNNEDFLGRVTKYAQRQKWSSLLKAFQTAVQKAGSPSQLPFYGKAALANCHISCFVTWGYRINTCCTCMLTQV